MAGPARRPAGTAPAPAAVTRARQRWEALTERQRQYLQALADATAEAEKSHTDDVRLNGWQGRAIADVRWLPVGDPANQTLRPRRGWMLTISLAKVGITGHDTGPVLDALVAAGLVKLKDEESAAGETLRWALVVKKGREVCRAAGVAAGSMRTPPNMLSPKKWQMLLAAAAAGPDGHRPGDRPLHDGWRKLAEAYDPPLITADPQRWGAPDSGRTVWVTDAGAQYVADNIADYRRLYPEITDAGPQDPAGLSP